MTVPLLEAVTRWACPNCHVTDVTRGPVPNRFHTCAGLHDLIAPLVPEGTDCEVRAVERGDYLAGEQQRTGDDGRPYMAVETRYADGRNDLAVFAGVAVAGASGGD